MKSAAAFKKNIYERSDNPWVQILVPGTDSISTQDVFVFRVNDIKNMRSFGADHTLLTVTGMQQEVLLSLPLTDTMHRLQQRDDAMIDLTAVTLIEGKDKLVKRLKDAFRRADEQKKEADIAAVTITAFVRAPQKSKFVPFTFAGKDIRLSDMKQGSSVHGGATINMNLYPEATSPFGDNEVIIEGKLEEFRAFCREAVQKGETKVDMSEYSMKKFKDISPADAREKHTQKSP